MRDIVLNYPIITVVIILLVVLMKYGLKVKLSNSFYIVSILLLMATFVFPILDENMSDGYAIVYFAYYIPPILICFILGTVLYILDKVKNKL